MNKYLLPSVISLMLTFAKTGAAEPFSLPVKLDYSLIKRALVTQVYKGDGTTAELWNDKHGCSFLKLSDPRVSGQSGQIKLVNNLQAQFGARIGGQCVTLAEWAGVLQTLQKLTINTDQSILSLPITDIIAVDQAGRTVTNDKIQNLIKRFAEPQLSAVKVDLNSSRPDIEKAVAEFLPKENAADVKAILSTLKFSSAEADDNGVAINMAFDAPTKAAANKPAAPLTPAEQKQWQSAWSEWDKALGKAINKAAADTHSPELRNTLTAILHDAGGAFKAGLKAQDANADDPVRVFFVDTWQRLAPQLKTLAKDLPEIQGLRYMTFIAATDVLYELESRGAPLGLSVSSDGLRRLARMLINGKEAQAKAK
ncbi:MAG: hypothetical protein NTV43_10970 [Methylococcales bacterium]|nr:hypothetical protein [Methylococcales bacterium]